MKLPPQDLSVRQHQLFAAFDRLDHVPPGDGQLMAPQLDRLFVGPFTETGVAGVVAARTTTSRIRCACSKATRARGRAHVHGRWVGTSVSLTLCLVAALVMGDLARLIGGCERRRAMAVSKLRGK